MRLAQNVCFCLISCTLLPAVFGGEIRKLEELGGLRVNLAKQVSSLHGEARDLFLEGVVGERLELQRSLLQLLATTQPKDVRCCAAYLLGMYRMEGAVRELAQHITLQEAGEEMRDRESLWGRYPVVEALVRIGNPVVERMIENIKDSPDKAVRELSARVIHDVYNADIGKFTIEKQIEREADPEKQKRLTDVLMIVTGRIKTDH